jgi:glyceraldehyde-3-phosphate dehydrogenase/erythrose-4-phosphate dehydrogenase
VPTPNVSIVDLVLQVEKKTFAEEVNEAFREAARGPSKGACAIPVCRACSAARLAVDIQLHWRTSCSRHTTCS